MAIAVIQSNMQDMKAMKLNFVQIKNLSFYAHMSFLIICSHLIQEKTELTSDMAKLSELIKTRLPNNQTMHHATQLRNNQDMSLQLLKKLLAKKQGATKGRRDMISCLASILKHHENMSLSEVRSRILE